MAAGVQRVLAKCKKCVESGDFYEAHQMYRTLSFRYSGAKKYAEAIDLLYNGSQTLLQHKQYSSGADLAMLLIEVLNTSKTVVTDENTDKVVDLLRNMDPDSPERFPYLNGAIRWTMKVDTDYKAGHPHLHEKCGMLFWQGERAENNMLGTSLIETERNYTQARYHYLHSNDGKNFATMLIEFHVTAGYQSEVDLFIAQTVLQFLVLKNKDTANIVFVTYTREHPQVETGPPYIRPLLNFIWLLLLALESGKIAVFTVLCEKYQTSISRDPSYKEYLDRIGQLFFGLPPPKSPSQGIFGNLIQSLLGEDDDSAPSTPMTPGADSRQVPHMEHRNESQVELD